MAYCKTQNLAEKTFINFVFDLRRQAKRRLVRRKAVLLLRAMHRLKPKLDPREKERKVDSFMRTLSRDH